MKKGVVILIVILLVLALGIFAFLKINPIKMTGNVVSDISFTGITDLGKWIDARQQGSYHANWNSLIRGDSGNMNIIYCSSPQQFNHNYAPDWRATANYSTDELRYQSSTNNGQTWSNSQVIVQAGNTSNFWLYNESWKIQRSWGSDGGLWQYDNYWQDWVWYQENTSTNLGTGWATVMKNSEKLDQGACANGLIYYNGYYYLYFESYTQYSGILSIYVARALNPQGTYEIWTYDGWKQNPTNSTWKPVLTPDILSIPGGEQYAMNHFKASGQGNPYNLVYGAGLAKVTQKDGKIYLYYIDTSYWLIYSDSQGNIHEYGRNINTEQIPYNLVAISSDPINFQNKYENRLVNISGSEFWNQFNPKYFPEQDKFYNFYFKNINGQNEIVYQTSDNGIIWNNEKIIGNVPSIENLAANSPDSNNRIIETNKGLKPLSDKNGYGNLSDLYLTYWKEYLLPSAIGWQDTPNFKWYNGGTDIYGLKVNVQIQENPQNLIEAGFDPGLNMTRISSSFDPSSQYYFESCPNEVGGKCYGNLPAGSGFYTLAWDNQLCKPNSGQLYNPDQWNSQVKCPFYFGWKNEGNGLIANLKVNTLNYKSPTTRNNYLGIQENIGGQVLYYGLDFDNMDHSPFIENITNISIKFRAKLCYKSKESDSSRYGRITYYVWWWNVAKQAGETLSIDLIQFWKPDNQKPNSLVSSYARESELAGMTQSDPNYWTSYHVIFVNGKYYGFVPQNYNFYLDNSADCSYNLSNSPFYEINIPLKNIIQDLVSKNLINQTILRNAKYSGGALGGIESWGRNLVELDVKDHHLYLSSIQQPPTSTCTFTYSPWITCNPLALQTRTIISQLPSGCSGGTPESLIQQCSPPCTIQNWQSIDSICSSSNTLTRTWTRIGNCNQTIGISKPNSESISCTYVPNVLTCTNFTYADWGQCLANGIQNRSLLDSFPVNCQSGNPILIKECNYTSLDIIQDNNYNLSQNNEESGFNEETNQENENLNNLPASINVTSNNNKTINLNEGKKQMSVIKSFFIKLICKLSSLFNESKYSSCTQGYLN